MPYRLLFPAVLVFSVIGVYSLNYSTLNIFLTALFGLFGYVCTKLKCESTPLLLGLVLGQLMEENLRRALLLARGDFSTFVTRPLSAILLTLTTLLIIGVALPGIRKLRHTALAVSP